MASWRTSVFGLVAALVFYAALSCLEPEEKEKVKFQENTEHVQKDPEKEWADGGRE